MRIITGSNEDLGLVALREVLAELVVDDIVLNLNCCFLGYRIYFGYRGIIFKVELSWKLV